MTLFLVSTPIGNMEDITLRALRVLREVDLVAAEDTRVTGRLLAAHDISKPLKSYHEHNDRRSARELIAQLEAGKDVALVTNAGSPCISDPGFRITRLAIERGVEVVPIPGPTALIAALQVSGLPVHRFLFAGFPPRKAKARRDFLAELAALDATLIFYESPFRIERFARDALDVLGPRPAALCRELTKKFEEVVRGQLPHLLEHVEQKPPKGELVLLVGGSKSRDVMPAAGGDRVEQA